MRNARNQADEESGDNQHDGVRRLEALGERREQNDAEQEQQDDGLGAMDVLAVHFRRRLR
jgi:hypothetical protein